MQKNSFSINSKRSYIDKLAKVQQQPHGPPSYQLPWRVSQALSKIWIHQTPRNEKIYVFGKWQIKLFLPITSIWPIVRCYMSYILYFASFYIIFTCWQLAPVATKRLFLLFWSDQLIAPNSSFKTWRLLGRKTIIRDATMPSQWRRMAALLIYLI